MRGYFFFPSPFLARGIITPTHPMDIGQESPPFERDALHANSRKREKIHNLSGDPSPEYFPVSRLREVEREVRGYLTPRNSDFYQSTPTLILFYGERR